MSDEIPVEDSNLQKANGSEGKSGRVPWLPLVIVLLVVPIITLAGVEFVVIPKLKAAFQEQPGEAVSKVAEEKADSGGHGGHGGKAANVEDPSSFKFEDIITNLSGTMGTRFIKISFEVTGKSTDLSSLVSNNKARVLDGIMAVLGSRTIRELEVVGGRNSLRVDLIEAINAALGKSAVEELYFVELIIQ